MITFPPPMQARNVLYRPFSSDDWLYEVKYEGHRGMAGIENSQCELRSKAGKVCTKTFPEIADTLAQLPGGPHVIDGEVCVLDDIGRSDFNRLQVRANKRRWYPGCDAVTLVAFDLLIHQGESVMHLPLVERKARLEKLLAQLPEGGRVLYLSDLPADEDWFHRAVMQLKLEGLMAKRKASPYAPGVRSDDWRKIKNPNWKAGRTWRPRGSR